MFALLSRIIFGVLLAVQLSSTIAAPSARLNTLRGLEVRAKNNNMISLFRNALPEDDTANPFIILDAPPPTVTVHAAQSRSLRVADGPGMVLHIEPVDDEPADEDPEWIGTDIEPLETTGTEVKRCIEDGLPIGTDVEPVGGGDVFKVRRHLPGAGDGDCGNRGTDDEPVGAVFNVKRHLPGEGDGNHQSSEQSSDNAPNGSMRDSTSSNRGKSGGDIFQGGKHW